MRRRPVAPNHLAEGVEISMAELTIGFQVVALCPLVPRFDEDDSIFWLPIFDDPNRFFCVVAKEIGTGPVQDESARPRAWRIIPIRNDTRVGVHPGLELIQKKHRRIFIMKNVRKSSEEASPSLQSHISGDPATHAKSFADSDPPSLKLDAVVVAGLQLTNRNGQHFQVRGHDCA